MCARCVLRVELRYTIYRPGRVCVLRRLAPGPSLGLSLIEGFHGSSSILNQPGAHLGSRHPVGVLGVHLAHSALSYAAGTGACGRRVAVGDSFSPFFQKRAETGLNNPNGNSAKFEILLYDFKKSSDLCDAKRSTHCEAQG